MTAGDNNRKSRLVCRLAALSAVAWIASVSAATDVVVTSAGPSEGTASLAASAVQIGGASVPASDVLWLVRSVKPSAGPAHSIHMVNGEIWRARVAGFEGSKLTVDDGIAGRAEIDMAAVAAVEFVHGKVPPAADATLFRVKGDSLPGGPVWIRDGVIAADSPFGVVTMPVLETLGFRTGRPVAEIENDQSDELGLIDGSVLRGKLALSADAVRLSHSAFGELALPMRSVRYFKRQHDGLTPLPVPQASMVQTSSPLGPAPGPLEMDLRWRFDDRHLRAIRMFAATTARFAVPERRGRSLVFRTAVRPWPAGQAARIRIAVGGKVIAERSLAASASPGGAGETWLSVELPDGDELTLETASANEANVPCGVEWCDPHIVPVSIPATAK